MSLTKSILTLALPIAFIALPAFGVTQELKLPEMKLSLQPKYKDVQSVTEEAVPEADPVLRIENKNPKAFCEFSFPKKMKLESFDTLKLTVNLDRKRTSTLQNLSVRIQDATGETLQYTLIGKALPEGDTILFTIDPNQKPFTSWGGNKDGKIDQPAQFLGGAFRFQDGAGTLFLRGFTVNTESKATE